MKDENAIRDFVTEEEKQALAEALVKLRRAWFGVLYAINDFTWEDVNDYIVDEFPFDRSFDEVDVPSWIEKCLENLGREYL